MTAEVINRYMLIEGAGAIIICMVVTIFFLAYSLFKTREQCYRAAVSSLRDNILWFEVNVLNNPSKYYMQEQFSIGPYSFQQTVNLINGKVSAVITHIENIDTRKVYVRDCVIIRRNYSYSAFTALRKAMYREFDIYTKEMTENDSVLLAATRNACSKPEEFGDDGNTD